MVQDEGATDDDDFSDLEESPEPDELDELLVESAVDAVLVLDEVVELPPLLPPRLEGLE